MTDDVDFGKFDEDYFTNLVSEVADHPDWNYREDNFYTTDEVARTASSFAAEAEFRLDHSETDGVLTLRAPNLTTPLAALAGELEQPLDRSQSRNPEPDSFGSKLAEAYQSIADEQNTEYTSADADPIAIQSIQVPLEYQSDSLYESLDAVSETSRKVQQLNNDIRNRLDL